MAVTREAVVFSLLVLVSLAVPVGDVNGEHCNITNTTSPQPQEVSADDPCDNLICSSYPDAVCVVVTKCCEKLLNSAGIAVDCGNHRPIEELRKTKCGNVCPFDPRCLGKTCSQHRVDYSSGEQISPQRTRRQSDSPTKLP